MKIMTISHLNVLTWTEKQQLAFDNNQNGHTQCCLATLAFRMEPHSVVTLWSCHADSFSR